MTGQGLELLLGELTLNAGISVPGTPVRMTSTSAFTLEPLFPSLSAKFSLGTKASPSAPWHIAAAQLVDADCIDRVSSLTRDDYGGRRQQDTRNQDTNVRANHHRVLSDGGYTNKSTNS